MTSSGATLNGSVNPYGQGTTYQFDYGPTPSYSFSVPSPTGYAGAGTSVVNESATLTGLRPGTKYYYRIEATNATGTTYGSDQTFTTSPPDLDHLALRSTNRSTAGAQHRTGATS